MKETCREAVLAAFDRLEHRHNRKIFSLSEIVQEVRAVTSDFGESAIRTDVTSRMCKQAPAHHFTRYADLDRVARGEYRRRTWSTNQE